jgi:hypothetical protein
MDIVVEAGRDRVDAIIALLPWIQILPSDDGLKLLRDQEVTCRYIVPVRCEVGEPWTSPSSKFA